ncbi:uncharacterized protein LOC134229738 [Saccostrea cucullata]|uniref:uncharacterized protein LOC134229738 n=1 Tax=Saccostrea cuccullata TaxID=36930 RepID=UPI002ED2794C
MLNEIRHTAHPNNKPLTSKEAKSILEILETRDFLWGDQNKITKDTRNETLYRIASMNSYIPFYISSYDIASVYLRTNGYIRKTGEKCVISVNNIYDPLLISRLQMSILSHMTMEDKNITTKVFQILNIPEVISGGYQSQRGQFLNNLEREGEGIRRFRGDVHHVTWLWRHGRPDIVRSCIGLHPHWDIYIINNKAYRKPNNYHEYSLNIRSMLYTVLLSEGYTVNTNDNSYKTMQNKILNTFFQEGVMSYDINTTDAPEGTLKIENNKIMFQSDDIQHDVMYAFVTECLVENCDLEFFLTMASHDVVSEYCRSWGYRRNEGERCLYVPNAPDEMYNIFIDKLQLDIIKHCTISDEVIHSRISRRLGVPEEILSWDEEARKRYVEYAKRGTQAIHHARGMIVGCAGAGKTTLLKRLLRCSEEDILNVTSTKGIDVHEDIFTICEDSKTLKGRTMVLNSITEGSHKTPCEKTVSFFDFGGQCAYYACHQIYLTRRAFYLLVIDASKALSDVVDFRVCDQADTFFPGWTYREYFIFWLKSIHTYCSPNGVNENRAEIVLIATHWENTLYKDKSDFLDSLLEVLPIKSDLASYIREDRCFLMSFPPSDPIKELEMFIVDIASRTKWNEKIPHEWTFLINEMNKNKMDRIVPFPNIRDRLPVEALSKENQACDMLRYYHDSGRILFFQEGKLRNFIILDVQWFVNAFKTIITDNLHVKGIIANRQDWKDYYSTGNLQDTLLVDIWDMEDRNWQTANFSDKPICKEDPRFLIHHKDSMLLYMQRLGLIAVGGDLHYIPCMNKRDFNPKVHQKQFFLESARTSVLVYFFKFLPYFLFYRLVVACLQIRSWKVLKSKGTKCLYKNAAMFNYKEHDVVIYVTSTSIQLQVVRKTCQLDKSVTLSIRNEIDAHMQNITDTFHKHLSYQTGYICSKSQIVGDEVEDRFIKENELGSGNEKTCPLHQVEDYHTINPDYLSMFWKHGSVAEEGKRSSTDEIDYSSSDFSCVSLSDDDDVSEY